MHPRNIYKTPPNFKDLAIQYPDFKKYISINVGGKVSFNFKDPKALAELSKTLLLRDFSLSVEIPTNHLVPTLPLRLNYLLWVEDLLVANELKDNIYGIDIGTGASCIYPLLAAKKGWKMLGTEVNTDSVEIAKNNVHNNALSDLITIKAVEDNRKIFQGFDENENFTFSMCNPPFFSNDQKIQNRSAHRPDPKNAFTGCSSEVVTDGGELKFLQNMFQESQQLGQKIRIYSSMIGRKYDFILLKKELMAFKPCAISFTEFIQGNTTRWGLAWTFDPNIKLPLIQEKKKKAKKESIFEYKIPFDWDLEKTLEHTSNLLNELEVKVKKDTVRNTVILYCEAFEKTWLHQRRKKRQKNESPPEKKQKLDQELPLLKFNIQFQQDDEHVVIKCHFISGEAGKEGLHQVLQFLKNNFVKLNG